MTNSLGASALENRPHQPLVGGVPVGVQEENRNRLELLVAVEHPGEPGGLARGELPVDAPVGQQSLVDLVDAVPRDEGLVLAKEQVERLRPVDASDLVDVCEAGRRDERRRRTAALEQRVDRDRRSVDERDRIRDLPARGIDRVEDARDEIVRRAEGLPEQDPARGRLERGDVGERPADVDTEPKRRGAAGQGDDSTRCETTSPLRSNGPRTKSGPW